MNKQHNIISELLLNTIMVQENEGEDRFNFAASSVSYEKCTHISVIYESLAFYTVNERNIIKQYCSTLPQTKTFMQRNNCHKPNHNL